MMFHCFQINSFLLLSCNIRTDSSRLPAVSELDLRAEETLIKSTLTQDSRTEKNFSGSVSYQDDHWKRTALEFPLWLRQVKNLPIIHEDAGLIRGFDHWVKDQALSGAGV